MSVFLECMNRNNYICTNIHFIAQMAYCAPTQGGNQLRFASYFLGSLSRIICHTLHLKTKINQFYIKMYKTTTFFKTAAMTVLLFMGMITAQAAVTYRLTTHPVFGASRELTGTASVSAGADLLDNMPQALWRAYTTYTFYADAALTEEITEVPAADATVYVDYVFDPAYIPSVEGQDPVWLLLRGYNESLENSYGATYLLYKEHSKNAIRGYRYTGSRPKAGNN